VHSKNLFFTILAAPLFLSGFVAVQAATPDAASDQQGVSQDKAQVQTEKKDLSADAKNRPGAKTAKQDARDASAVAKNKDRDKAGADQDTTDRDTTEAP